MTDTHGLLPLTPEKASRFLRDYGQQQLTTILEDCADVIDALSARALAAEARVKEAEGIIERSANALDWLDHLKQPTEEHLKKCCQEGRKAISAYFAKHRSA